MESGETIQIIALEPHTTKHVLLRNLGNNKYVVSESETMKNWSPELRTTKKILPQHLKRQTSCRSNVWGINVLCCPSVVPVRLRSPGPDATLGATNKVANPDSETTTLLVPQALGQQLRACPAFGRQSALCCCSARGEQKGCCAEL